MGARILVSAGEASGDRYCGRLVECLRARLPGAEFFGCAGPAMQAAGVEPLVDAASLSVVGLVEVLRHIPRIYGEYRKMIAVARERHPDFAVLTDSPDFHLRLAPHVKKLGIPVVYLVAPQVWAWREGRIGTLRRNVDQLHCIFPFEENYFRDRGVPGTYIGHPLSRVVRPQSSRTEFLRSHGLDPSRPLVVLCPGSRGGEIARHRTTLAEAARIIRARKECEIVLAVPNGSQAPKSDQWRIVEGQTWDALAHAEAGLLASGTVTVEAALLQLPFVSFYKVSPLSWAMGRRFVRVPHLTMVNLIAGRRVVPEWMQDEATPERLAGEVLDLLDNRERRAAIRSGLGEVASALTTAHDPMEFSADLILQGIMKGNRAP